MKRQTITFFLITIVLLFPYCSLLIVNTQTSQDEIKIGPFLEKLVFNVVTQRNQQVHALQEGEVDMIGNSLSVESFLALESSEQIETTSRLGNGYGFMTLNTAKYPLNITAFRRAIAFALDKEVISELGFMNLSEPLDSCIPKLNPLSIEEQLTDNYYTPELATAKQLLADAGFSDIDSDGVIEAPNGSELCLEVFILDEDSGGIPDEVGGTFEAALEALDINYTRQTDDWICDIYERLYNHQDYDLAFMRTSFSGLDVDWMAREFWSGNADVPYTNFANFRNSTFDSLRAQLLNSTNLLQVSEAAGSMQKLIAYECPIIVLYEDYDLTAYRTDQFEGHITGISEASTVWWTSYKAHIKDFESSPIGGTFELSIPHGVDTFNPMMSTTYGSEKIFSLLFDSLIRLDQDGNDVLWLAESMLIENHDDNPDVQEGNMRFTFDIVQNATWSDGTLLTAEDIAFALDYYRNITTAPLGNSMSANLEHIESITANTAYQLQVEFESENYWLLHGFCYKPILPKQMLSELGPDGWEEWSPNPQTETITTSGPYRITDYVEGESIELTRNPDYHYGFYPTIPNTTVTTTDSSPFSSPLFILGSVGAVSVLVVAIVMWSRKN